MKITIEREGSFSVGWSHSHSRQCGTRGTQVLQFRAKVEGTTSDVNRNGWLIDNNDIPGYFTRAYSKVRDFLPCEEIATKACHDFREVVKKNGGKARCVSVSVSGIPGSWITAEWKEAGWGG